MTEKLDNLLAETLQTVLSGIDATTQFAAAQLPDVINQLLTWYFVYYILLALFAVILLGLQIYASYWWITKMEPKMSPAMKWMGTAFGVSIVGLMLLLIEASLFNLQWLKIWLAPKLWLIEYSATLVK